MSDLELECHSDNGNEVQEEEERNDAVIVVRGVLPHQFEPLARNANPRRRQNRVVVNENELYRGRKETPIENWCTCGCCIILAHFTDLECRCCREIPKTLDVANASAVRCVTQIPDFEPAILNQLTLKLAWETFTQHYRKAAKSFNERGNEKYRYAAYRQFVRLCWGYLGKEVRVYTPACAHATIDNAYPDARNRYRGTVIIQQLDDFDDSSDDEYLYDDEDDEDEQL